MTFPQDSFKKETDPGKDDDMIRAKIVADGIETKGFEFTGKKICVQLQYPDWQERAYSCVDKAPRIKPCITI
ncbi:MAG: hypothetical protein WBB48_13450 [Thermodesulfobacteriota bacterium]